jgi:hypothetical protein
MGILTAIFAKYVYQYMRVGFKKINRVFKLDIFCNNPPSNNILGRVQSPQVTVFLKFWHDLFLGHHRHNYRFCPVIMFYLSGKLIPIQRFNPHRSNDDQQRDVRNRYRSRDNPNKSTKLLTKSSRYPVLNAVLFG